MIKVMKFGGTSLGGVEAIERTASIISRESAKKVVVVSAMSGVTNSLINGLRERRPISDIIGDLRERYLTCANSILGTDPLDQYGQELNLSLDDLRRAMEARYEFEIDHVLDDTISSWGERLSSLTMAHVLRARGIESVPLSSERAGIVAEGQPGNGSANLKETHRNLQQTVVPLLQQGITPIVTGYYGCDVEGRPLTFGRGGSDYSSSVIAYGIDANCCEIWTDVNGFMTADPRAVPSAKSIEEMDYNEAAELAYFGAKVLHPRTIEPVRRKGIPLVVKNSFDPDARGTIIRGQRINGGVTLRSVAVKSDLSIVKVYSSEIVYQPGLISRLVGVISDAAVNSYAVSTSLSTLAMVIPSTAAEEVKRRIDALNEPQVEKVSVKSKISLICCVGDNLLNTPGVSARVFAKVAEVDANIELISEGASDVALNFMVPSEKAQDVVRAIHNAFIGG